MDRLRLVRTYDPLLHAAFWLRLQYQPRIAGIKLPSLRDVMARMPLPATLG